MSVADEPGLGKTAQAIRALKKLQEDGTDPFPALIVCPNTLKKNWEREFTKWWPEVKVQVIKGTATQRRKQFQEVIESNTCKIHNVTQNSKSMQKTSAAAATKKTLDSETPNTLKDNEKIVLDGLNLSAQFLPENGTSKPAMESQLSSMNNSSQMLNIDADSALIQQKYLTTATTQEEFAESSVGDATQLFTKQSETLLGSTEQNCTCPSSVVVINWESLRSHSRLAPYGSVALARCSACGGHDDRVSEVRCEVHQRELNVIDFQSVIADEMHRSKEPKSKQTRALWAASGNAEIRFALTGTPVANNVLDMWSILHWLSPDEWPSKTRWIDRMVDTMLNAFGGMMVLGVKPSMEQEFHAAINPRMRRMLKQRVLPWLPEMMFERRDVEMSVKQAKAYKDMREHMIAELEGAGETVVAPSVLTQTTRLHQFASSFAEMVTDETTLEQKIILAEPSCKVDAVMDDIKEGDFGDDSVAVAAVSRQLIELLSARMTKEGIAHGLITGAQTEDERTRAIDDFQSGKIKWILFTVQAGGVGVTLTAARRLIMLQRPWSLVDHKQALDRIHRIGSEIHDSVIIMDYVTEGTIEERVLQVLETKADNFEQIVRDKDKLLELLKDDKAGKL